MDDFLQKVFIIFLLVLSFLGCSSVTVVSKRTYPQFNREPGKNIKEKVRSYVETQTPDYKKVHDFWLFGLGQTVKIPLKEMCPQKDLVAFRAYRSKEDSIYTVATLTIYSPRTFEAWCETKKISNNPVKDPNATPRTPASETSKENTDPDKTPGGLFE